MARIDRKIREKLLLEEVEVDWFFWSKIREEINSRTAHAIL